MTSIILPIVHLNGTSKGALIESRSNVYDALRQVLDVMREMAPNGRDYYPQPGLMEKALEQHHRRGKVIADLMTELEQEIAGIEEAS